MPMCSALNCNNNGIHAFPKDDNRRKQWVAALRRKHWQPSSSSRLCRNHFKPEDYFGQSKYNAYKPVIKCLKKTAVPSIFSVLAVPSNPLSKKREKRSSKIQQKINPYGDHTYSIVYDEQVTTTTELSTKPPKKWEIKKQLCRCCLVEGSFDSLHSLLPGNDITYYDVLMQTFSIELFPVLNDVTDALYGVCGLCAGRLRDAHAFRHQVSATEARFRDLYTRDCITVNGATDEIETKQETLDIDNYPSPSIPVLPVDLYHASSLQPSRSPADVLEPSEPITELSGETVPIKPHQATGPEKSPREPLPNLPSSPWCGRIVFGLRPTPGSVIWYGPDTTLANISQGEPISSTS